MHDKLQHEAPTQQEALQRLSDILDLLRRDCPWDREQTLQSLRYLSIEEVFELSEAITAVTEEPDQPQHYADLKKELGDLLLHIFFYSRIAHDLHQFDIVDVANAVSDKLVKRHPHIFAGGQQVPWEKVKMREGRHSVLEGVPRTLPPLVKAVRMQEKAEGIGYSENDGNDLLSQEQLADETVFGDTLLHLLHQAHRHGINADNALAAANLRYQRRVEEWEAKKES